MLYSLSDSSDLLIILFYEIIFLWVIYLVSQIGVIYFGNKKNISYNAWLCIKILLKTTSFSIIFITMVIGIMAIIVCIKSLG